MLYELMKKETSKNAVSVTVVAIHDKESRVTFIYEIGKILH